MTLTLDSAGIASVEELRVAQLFPDAVWLKLLSSDFREMTLELSSSDPAAFDYFREAQIVHGLHPATEPDDPSKIPGKSACHNCGRSSPPGGLTHTDYRPVYVAEHVDPETLEHTRTVNTGPAYRDPAGTRCVDRAGCEAARRDREEEWATNQVPRWRQDYRRYLDAARKRLEATRQTAWSWYHPQQMQEQEASLEAGERQLRATADDDFAAALAAVEAATRPPDSFFGAVALAAGEGEGIFAEEDTSGPAPFQMLPPTGWEHTLRNPANRAHLHGAMRQHKGVTDAASALARSAVS